MSSRGCSFPGTPAFFTAFRMLPTNPSFTYNTGDRHRRDPRRPSQHDVHDVSLQRPGTSFTPNNGFNTGRARPETIQPISSGSAWTGSPLCRGTDGVKCGQFNGSASTIESGPMQLILHMMIDNQWERDWGSVLSSQAGLWRPAGSGLHPHLPAAVGPRDDLADDLVVELSSPGCPESTVPATRAGSTLSDSAAFCWHLPCATLINNSNRIDMNLIYKAGVPMRLSHCSFAVRPQAFS